MLDGMSLTRLSRRIRIIPLDHIGVVFFPLCPTSTLLFRRGLFGTVFWEPGLNGQRKVNPRAGDENATAQRMEGMEEVGG